MTKTILAALSLAAASCSVLPPREFPEFRDAEYSVEWSVKPGEEREVPASSQDLTVLSLTADPAPSGERFRDGKRYLFWENGATVQARIQVRDWGFRKDSRLRFRTAVELFPDANAVVVAPTP